MKKNKLLIISLFLIYGSINSFAQNNIQNATGDIIVSICPQYTFVNGMRFDIEYNLKNKKQWIGIAPQLYYSDNGNVFEGIFQYDSNDEYNSNSGGDFDTLSGFGIEVYHKIFLLEENKPKGFYLNYGLTFGHFNLKYHTYQWKTTMIDELEYIEYKPVYQTHSINKLGVNLMIGYQFELSDYLYLDAFSGVGMRYSFHSKEVNEIDKFNDNSFDFGYSGATFLFGLKLGVNL